MENGMISYLNENFNLSIPPKATLDQWVLFLSEKINHLVAHDFNQLVQILYRIDVSEQKLKALLKNNPGTDAGRIIAELVIERQIEKFKSRQQFKKGDTAFDEEEKW